jgi:hypothetical protein
MNRGNRWLSTPTRPTLVTPAASFAVDTWNTILERPSTIIVTRGTASNTEYSLEPQIVRVEVFQGVRQVGETRSEFINISKQYVIVIGIKDHPVIPDTNLKRGDTFFFDGLQWEIKDYVPTVPGRLLVSGEITP